MQLQNEILKTLLYFDIWSYPLDAQELYAFLPVNSMTLEQFKARLNRKEIGDAILEHEGFYFVRGRTSHVVADRRRREIHAKRMWRMARLSTHIIKRFPFVRGVFVSGSLSKNATHSKSDIDFFIITEPNRLWIARSLLVLFKKIILLNSKKYFCINYFSSTANLEFDEENVFFATEVATLKPLFNTAIFLRYLEANRWILRFFPNFDIRLMTFPNVDERHSRFQKLFELPFSFFNADKLDRVLMHKMERLWAKRYPFFDEQTRNRIFKCTPTESRAYVGNFEDKILSLYRRRLEEFGVRSRHETQCEIGLD